MITLLGLLKIFGNSDPYRRLALRLSENMDRIFELEPNLKDKIITEMNMPDNYKDLFVLDPATPWQTHYLWQDN